MHKRYSKRKPPTTSAFTIIELLIVIVVIGILATITIVAYSNIQNRARTAALTSSLSQAATKLKTYDIEIGSYPESLTDINIHSSEAVTYIYHKDNNSNPRSFCITAIKNNLVYKVTDTTQPSPGGCGMHTWPGGVVMTNMVVNGDFGNGINNWTSNTSAYSRSTTSGALAMTVVTDSTSADYLSQGATAGVPGHVYYVAYEMNPFRTHAPQAYIGGSFGRLAPSAAAGVFTRGSVVIAAVSTSYLHIYANASVSTGAVIGAQSWFRNVLLIDLTATFGSGNEPTKEQMDQIMQQFSNSWFSGTVTANTQGIL